jgi:hypothetical protein
LRDREASRYLERLPQEERHATWRLVLRDGTLVGRGAGGVELLEAMSLTRPASRVLAHVPRAVLDQAYEIAASQRSRLGRLVPDGPGPRRFP